MGYSRNNSPQHRLAPTQTQGSVMIPRATSSLIESRDSARSTYP
jgi:hypothetical protein